MRKDLVQSIKGVFNPRCCPIAHNSSSFSSELPSNSDCSLIFPLANFLKQFRCFCAISLYCSWVSADLISLSNVLCNLQSEFLCPLKISSLRNPSCSRCSTRSFKCSIEVILIAWNPKSLLSYFSIIYFCSLCVLFRSQKHISLILITLLMKFLHLII